MKRVHFSQLCSTFCVCYLTVVTMTNFLCCSASDKIFITMVTQNPLSSSYSRAYYYCFVNASDFDVTVSTRRVIQTRGNPYFDDRNPEPSTPVHISNPRLYPAGASVYWVNLNDFDNSYEFGTYACDASSEDGLTTSVSNIIMMSSAIGRIYPADDMVTHRVNVGDNGVTIEMRLNSVEYWLSWRYDGAIRKRYTLHNGTYSSYQFTRAIEERDEGVYICNENDHWNEAYHGMQRLIVRGCRANRWGPPNCNGICDNCYNGGVCDDETGQCICPPGFMGPNCLTACGRNMFGYNCEFRCTEGDGVYSCASRQFCLIDPYGCSCSTGLTGLDCYTRCGGSRFGANCLQDCHCRQSCDDFTGECPRTCEEGWSGESCQIPSSCPSDYYGSECLDKCHCKNDAPCDKMTGMCPERQCSPGHAIYGGSISCQECRGGYFGDNCQGECRCEDSACDRVTGECSGQCKPQWISPSCEAGLLSSEPATVNPNTAAEVTCTAEGRSSTLSSYRQILSRRQDAEDRTKIIASAPTSSYEGGIVTRTTTFQVEDVTTELQLFCLLIYRYGNTIEASLPVTVSVYNLPELPYPPQQVNATSSDIVIRWRAWDPKQGVGDAPVEAYLPHYRESSSDQWMYGSYIQLGDTLEFKIADLEPDTSYMFAVAAVREGQGGVGPPSPSLIVKTLCDAEPSTLVEVSASLTNENEVRVTWQITGEVMCSTGISNYSVYYVTEGSTQEPNFVTMVTKDLMEIEIKSSVLGNGSHTFYVTFTTDVESILNIQDGKTSNATVSVRPKTKDTTDGTDSTDGTDTDGTSKQASDSPPIVLFIAPVLALFLLFIIVGTCILFRTKKTRRKESPPAVYGNVHSDEKEAPNVSGEYEGIGNKSGQSEAVVVDIQNQTASLKRSTTLEEYEETEDLEEEDGEHIYGNLQAPDPIKVAMFEDYVISNADNLEQEYEILKKGKQHPWTIAESESNKKKNRFKNMLTYDHSRVILSKIPGDPSSDYYNASYIQDQKGENAFIASQGPNTASLNDFWRIVWEQNVSTIVMTTNLYEGGKDRCTQYWPEAEGSVKVFGDLEVTWSNTSTFSDFDIRKLMIRNLKGKEGKPHQVEQFHFLTWPDMSVPKEVTPVLEFVKQVKLAGKEKKTPTLVHCSAGIGRTGTFIALSCLMEILTKEKFISVFDFVQQMRQNRINMVQTSKQYLFLYKCLLECHQTRHTEKPAGLLESFDLNSKRDVLLQEHKLLAEIGDVILKMKKKQESLREVYQTRNRFPDKVPYDGSRPFLMSWGSAGNEEGYINATILKSFIKQDAFITTQSPLPNTIEDFWRMVFDWDCPLVVMLNQLDPDDETCVQYWSGEDSAEYGSMTVTCVVEENEKIFTRRVFEISHVHYEGMKSVHHLQLHSWPPESNLSAVLGLIQEVEKLQHHLSIMSPIAVHCIDGVSRSGVFVTVMSELQRIERNQSVDVFSTVRQLRQRHPEFLSSEEDYLLCYQLLKAHLVDNNEYQNI